MLIYLMLINCDSDSELWLTVLCPYLLDRVTVDFAKVHLNRVCQRTVSSSHIRIYQKWSRSNKLHPLRLGQGFNTQLSCVIMQLNRGQYLVE